MNSTIKGSKFEDEMFNLLQDLISNDRFFVKKDSCKIFKKKGYYSKDREKNIIFDISIEVFLPNQTSHSLLILIECKNYNHSVPVDDIEEFYTKIQQISGGNIKGIIASKSSYQQGALTFSKSKGIGLLRYYDTSNFKWELTRSPSSIVSSSYALEKWSSACSAISIESYINKYFDCNCYNNGNYTVSLKLFFFDLINNLENEETKKLLSGIKNEVNEDSIVVKYLESSEIESIANSALDAISYENGEIYIDKICEWQKQTNGLRVLTKEDSELQDNNNQILGKITFDPPEITIFQNNSSIARKKFTLAHELGHLLLGHSKYMAGEFCQEVDFEFESQNDLGIKDIMRMEWQANYFASCLLLPKKQFLNDFYTIADSLRLEDHGFGILYVDKQKCNLHPYYFVTNLLKSKYRVSRSVVKIRLKKLGLLNEDTHNNTWDQVLY